MKLAHVLAIARAEMRLTRRLVRYWVFLALSFILGGLVYLQYAAIHAFFSSYSATAASIGPRYLVGAMGLYYMIVFMVGLVFLGFDLRSRDSRERMVEVLDSRPFTNLELVVGRFFGLLVPAWIPVVVLVLIFEAVGYLLPALGSPIGEPIEPVSLIAFTVFMAIPAFSFSLALVFLVTLLVRNRLVAAVLALAVLVGLSWGALRLPLYYGPFFDITGGYVVNFPSEILPGIADGVGWLQRLAVLLAACGLLGLAAAVHPRLDGGSKGRTAAGAGALLAIALVLMGTGSQMRKSVINRLEHWRQAHAARADEPAPDITAISGTVRIDPGEELELDLELSFRAPDGDGLENALFTLNPGLEVIEASSAGGSAVPFSHEDGLLELAMALQGSDEGRVHLLIRGRPDNVFAYLDAARTPEALIAWEAQIFLLGFERGLFRDSYVALMPGIGWLPSAGADANRDDPRVRPRDFFDLDIEVNLPDGWLVAGPGKRREADGGGGSFRFAPPAPLPEVALIAAPFVSYATEIGGVWMEVLVDSKHTRNFSELADAGEEVKTWIREHLEEAADYGLSYPYDGFTLVEVPTILRGYGGGWRLDTAMAPPAMMLMRESGFPTARFDVPFRNPEDFNDREGGLPRAKRDRLEAFCINDFSGGSIFVGAARSFFNHQTAAGGPTGLALNYVLEELTTITLTGSRGYFSAHMFTPELNQAIGRIIQTYFTGPRQNFAAAVIETFTSRPEVWNAVMGASLSDFDPNEDPQRTVDVLALKGGALAQSVVDELGAELTAELLSNLREKYSGGTFELGDVVAASAELDEDLGQLFTDWLTSTELPAFVGEHARAFRLEDADDGSPRYQLTARVRNDESTQGLFRFSYRVGGGDDSEIVKSDPIRLRGRSALRWGTVVSRPPQTLFIEPYLSLNRDPFRIPMDELDEEKLVQDEPFEGTEEIEWALPEVQWIAVDDLDEGFSIVEGDTRSGVRLGAKAAESETDQGLPLQEFGTTPADWSRATSSTAYGRYRHTLAYVKPGKGKTRAVFTTTVPHAGSWDLEIHLPHKQRFRNARDWGVWNLEVDNQGDTQTEDFDAAAAPRGWNLVGSFELADGEVSVALPDTSTGRVVIADAIRWIHAAGDGAAEADGAAEVE